MIRGNTNKILLALLGGLFGLQRGTAQQEPQYTQYQYNTMTVNPGYTGSQGYPSIVALYRDQWLGIADAPRTISLGIDAPYNLFNSLGLSIVRDEEGPAEETYIDGNYSHSLILNRKGHRLNLGLKAGVKILSVDWSKGRYRDPDPVFEENIKGRLLPSLGVGVFYYTDNAYLGLSTPNLLHNQLYDDVAEAVATDRIHVYFIGGYVFELSPSLKFKPSTFVKFVSGAPLSVDVSGNFLINNTVNLGASYRWDDSASGMIGFYVSPQLVLGYAYDYSFSDVRYYSSGTHEVFLRFNLIPPSTKIKSPRFF